MKEKYMLTKEDLLAIGYEINPDPDQAEKFYWHHDGDGDASKVSFDSEAEAIADCAWRDYSFRRMQCSDCHALRYPIVFEESSREEGAMSDMEYVEKGGCTCPFCGSDDIEGGSFNADAGYATQETSCNECDRSWEDQYTLTGYIAS
jgi:hypothetical protein